MSRERDLNQNDRSRERRMQEQKYQEAGVPGGEKAAEEKTEAEKAPASEADTPAAEAPTNGWLEQVYSRFDGVPLKALDIFIGICVFAFIAVIAVGIMKARGIL